MFRLNKYGFAFSLALDTSLDWLDVGIDVFTQNQLISVLKTSSTFYSRFKQRLCWLRAYFQYPVMTEGRTELARRERAQNKSNRCWLCNPPSGHEA
jgi:hypothetical protein